MRNKLKNKTTIYAFILGVFSIIIGADLAHLPALIQMSPTSIMKATIGGAGILDLIFLTGILSVLFVNLFSIIMTKVTSHQHINSKYLHT